MISAALERAFEDPSTLFYYEDGYILALWCAGNEEPCALCEFGEQLGRPDGFLPHLYEHGRVLMDGCAASELRRLFGNGEM